MGRIQRALLLYEETDCISAFDNKKISLNPQKNNGEKQREDEDHC
jgi:hypothetical protein